MIHNRPINFVLLKTLSIMRTVFVILSLIIGSSISFAQEAPPFFQWSLALDIGHSFSLNRPYYTDNAVAEATGYSPKGSAFIGGQVGMTWQHQHRLSFVLELLLYHYDYHYEVPSGNAAPSTRISASGLADNYVALGAVYQYNVLQHPRGWWGPLAQLGLGMVSQASQGWEGLTYRVQPPSYMERVPVVGIYGLGTEGGYALIPEKLWIEGSIRFWNALHRGVVTQYLPYRDANQVPQNVTIYNGLFNINISAKLRYAF